MLRAVFGLTLLAVVGFGGPTAAQQTFVDPFAYCDAKITVEAPGAEWQGPAVPETILRGLRQRAQLGDAMPDQQLAQQTHWRCMQRQVYACFVGANLPCMEKGDADRTPTTAMNDFCKEHPGIDFIPAATTGRATIYQWQCNGQEAQATGKLYNVDPAGFIREFWYPISPSG
ncbi:MAG: hypothetical protein AAFY56_01870 [Pseudomonadota bacterium]